MTDEGASPLESEVSKADFFKTIGYSTVWEDEQAITIGLRPSPGARVLSITSGACFSLQFLLHDVSEVVSLDFNFNQTALLEIKMAAARGLSHQQCLEMLGLAPCQDRLALYERVERHLSPEARRYWQHNKSDIQYGVGTRGRQDRYLHLVGRAIAQLQGTARVNELLSIREPEEQRAFYDKKWNRLRWRFVCGLLFNRFVFERAFDKQHFAYSEKRQIAGLIRQSVERTISHVPTYDNFYLHYLFRKAYPSHERCPAWLRASTFSQVSERVDRIVALTSELEKYVFDQPDDSFDCFNFSNIFDWVSKENFAVLMKEVVRVAKPGARLCYWSNIVNTMRTIKDANQPSLVELEELSAQISRRSRTPGYSGCVVAQVNK
jgi:S-adenosylmethionine:diacylglycerol 3-amino-3-carboxypropyl transferase